MLHDVLLTCHASRGSAFGPKCQAVQRLALAAHELFSTRHDRCFTMFAHACKEGSRLTRDGGQSHVRIRIYTYVYMYTHTHTYTYASRAPACSNEKENYFKITCCRPPQASEASLVEYPKRAERSEGSEERGKREGEDLSLYISLDRSIRKE